MASPHGPRAKFTIVNAPNRSRWFWISSVLAVLSLAWPARVAALDLTTSTITVMVAGPSTDAMVVDITAAAGGLPRWTAPVPGEGRRTFQELPPGSYVVRVTMIDGSTAQTTVDVAAGDRVVLEVTQSPSAAPRIDLLFRDRHGLGMDFTAGELADLPTGRDLWAVLDSAAPFVITDRIDNGGLATGGWPRVGMRGASWTAAKLFVGDMELESPTPRGAMLFYPDLTGMASVSVFNGVASPSVATAGAAVTLVPRRPGAERRTSVGGTFITPEMVATNPVGPAPVIGQLRDAQHGYVRWEGPLTDRLGAVVAASVSHASTTERDRTARATSRVASFVTHVVASPSDRDEVRIFASAQALTHPFEAAPASADRVVDERSRLFCVQVTWDRNEGGSRRALSVGVQRGVFTPEDASALGGTIDRASDGPVPAPASRDTLRTMHARLTFAPASRRIAGRDHGLSLSLQLRRTDASAHVLGSPVLAETVFGIPARAWVATPPDVDSSRRVTSLVLSANDDIGLARRLTLSLGLRADLSNGRARGSDARISWRSAAPLAVVRWRPEVLSLFAGYRRYVRPLTTDLLAFGDPGEPLVDVHRWVDADMDEAFDVGELGTLVARAGRAAPVASIAPDLSPSYTDEFSWGAERRLGSVHYLRLTAAVRHEHDLVRSVNTGAPASAYRTLSVANEIDDPKRARDGLLTVYDRRPESFGQDFYVLSNVPGEAARYRGLELTWEVRSPRWFTLLGASAYEASGAGGNRGFRVNEADPGVIGELFENPNAESVVDSRQFFDRAYVLKWSTVYRAPRGFTAGFVARYQDGQPFARMVLVPGLAQGAEVVAADYSEATRFTFTGTIDVRVAKAFDINGRRATAIVDVFNVSNLAEEVEENPVGGATFRDSTAMQPRRTVRIGLQVDF